MDPTTQRLFEGAAGAGGDGLGIEDVFSTWLYTGNGSTQTITNGIDLAGEGGLVWIKNRDGSYNHNLVDTERGYRENLATNSTSGQFSDTLVREFTSSGFVADSPGSSHLVNFSGDNYASWTFRKAPGFFDVVTYTGDGVNGRTVAHNLGSVPGFLLVKCTSAGSTHWRGWHRTQPGKYFTLVSELPFQNDGPGTIFEGVSPTDSVFTVSNDTSVNAFGQTYVAYLFAHDEQIFGESGDQSVIKCGSFTATGSDVVVDLGWEPQWLLIRNATSGSKTTMYDNMRGLGVNATGTTGVGLFANTSAAEFTTGENQYAPRITPTGFVAVLSLAYGSGDLVYIAIRRGPMKTPTDATEVFNSVLYTGDGTAGKVITTNVLTDLFFNCRRTGTEVSGIGYNAHDRLRGDGGRLQTYDTAAETSSSSAPEFDLMTGIDLDGFSGGAYNASSAPYVLHAFRRAPGFFDVVAYTGTGVARTVSHNLGVAPELIIHKRRDGTGGWRTDFVGGSIKGNINETNSFTSGLYFDGTISSTEIGTTLTGSGTNASSATYIAYLFASCPGVSKCFNYTGTGTTLQIDCGFASGARFVMIKRTDSTGSWYVWDTARGIVSGNDPYLLLNSSAAEVTSTDYIDPYSAGFEISSSAPAEINASGGSYIGLAIS